MCFQIAACNLTFNKANSTLLEDSSASSVCFLIQHINTNNRLIQNVVQRNVTKSSQSEFLLLRSDQYKVEYLWLLRVVHFVGMFLPVTDFSCAIC